MPIPFLIGLGVAAVGVFVGSAAIAAAYEVFVDSVSVSSIEETVHDTLYEHREQIGNEITMRIQEKNYNEIQIGLFNDHYEDTMKISANEISDDVHVGYEKLINLV